MIVGGPHAVRAALDSKCDVAVVYVEEGAGRRASALATTARERSVAVNPVGASCWESDGLGGG